MKKAILKIFGVAALAAVAFINVDINPVEADIAGLNLQLLKQAIANSEGGSIVNGPGQSYKCPGVFSGSGLDCLASNPYSCQPRSC